MMTTPTIEQIHRHRTIRSYRDEPVPPVLIETLVAAAQRSSTSSNLQLFSAVVVTNPATRARLAELCGDQAHIREAPVFIAWCADNSRLDRACALRGYTQESSYVESFLMSAVDTAIAMQNAALAAESLGLGICYIGGIRNRTADVIELLQLPHLVFPISGMTLGWPAADPPQRPRLALDAVLHWEHYSNEGLDDQLAAYDQAMSATGIYGGRQVPVEGKPGQSEEYGWTEHSARRVSRPARVDLRAVLAQQGFDLE